MDQLAVVWVDSEQDDEMQVDFSPPKPPVGEFHSISPALPRFDPLGLDWAPYTGRSSMAKPVEPAPVTPPTRTAAKSKLCKPTCVISPLSTTNTQLDSTSPRTSLVEDTGAVTGFLETAVSSGEKMTIKKDDTTKKDLDKNISPEKTMDTKETKTEEPNKDFAMDKENSTPEVENITSQKTMDTKETKTEEPDKDFMATEDVAMDIEDKKTEEPNKDFMDKKNSTLDVENIRTKTMDIKDKTEEPNKDFMDTEDGTLDVENTKNKNIEDKKAEQPKNTIKGKHTAPKTPESSGSEDTQETWVLGQPPPKKKAVAAKAAAAKAAAAKAKTQGGKAKKETTCNSRKVPKSKKVIKRKTQLKPKQSEAERKRKHRIACDNWHARWLSKGVPRPAEEEGKPSSSSAPVEKPNKSRKAKNADASKKAKTARASKKAAADSSTAGTTESQQADSSTTAPQTNSGIPKEIKEALVLDGINLVPSNDMRVTKGRFVKCYVENLTAKENEDYQNGGKPVPLLTNAEKYQAGLKAWMNSNLRGALASSKAGRGFAAVPCSILMV